MRTPEEIKKELERCTTYIYGFPCEGCLYGIDAEKVESDCVDALLKDALAYIQQLEAAQPKWVSVEEKLPEFGRYLVITKKDNDVGTVNTATYNDMGWWVLANFGEITHWMPIPEPPKDDYNE